MNKKYLLILTIIAFLLFGCEADLNTDTDSSYVTATVTLKITDATELRSILPAETTIEAYKVTLQNNNHSDVSYTSTFTKGSEITFEEVLVGTYLVTVDGYSDESANNKVATGNTELTVKADGANTASVTLDWLSEGTGSFSVTIDWKNLTKEDNILYNAIQKKSLGFLAWDKNNNKAYSNAEIEWAGDNDFENKSFTYSQSDIEKGTTNVSFRIYSKIDGADQVIAETFYTAVTIYANITSYPDGNESFSLDNSNIVYYLKNVTGVKASLNSVDSATKIDISWSYPTLNDGTYLLKSWITNNTTGETVDSRDISYTVTKRKASGDTSLTFEGLDPQYTYSVHFINYTNDENLVYSYSAEIIPLTAIRTKVKVQTIAFEEKFASSYVMGDSVTVGAVITPDDATNKDYTVSASEGVTVSDKTVTFPSSGDYTITLTSEDEDATENRVAVRTVTVKLSTPQNFTLDKTAEGMALSWDRVNGATSYTIEKSYSNTTETLTSETNSYVDSSVKTGVEYTYKVKAVRNDNSKFDSSYSAELTEKITNSFITVTVPENITSESFQPILETAIVGQFVTDLKGITVEIDTSESTLLSSAATFKWLLNGEQIGEENSKSIDIESTNVNISANETTNTLQLIVTKNGTTYSASTSVYYIATDPGELTITTEEDTVRYGEGITLDLKTATENNVDCTIVWSSSNEKVATVNAKGEVTALTDGTAEITATVVATGKSATKTIKTYISVKSIKITNNCDFLLANYKLTDNGKNNYTSTTLGLTFVGENDKEASADAKKKIEWSIEGNCATVNNGTVSSYNYENGGTAKITVTSTENNSVKDSISIPVYRFDIYDETGSNVITDKQYTIKLWQGGKTVYALVSGSANNTDKFYYNWETSKSKGLTLDIDSNKTSYNPKIGDNTDYTHTVSVTISDNNGKSVANLSFTRVS